ncbi:MAG: sucrose-phosphate phosphatase, partial [Sulfobacillus thermotolerans]|nr:sucrose-phosphate phosphatase [Sulfobacillus thermotolerans]
MKRVLATDIDGTLIGHGGEQAVRDYLMEHPELGVIYLT